MDTKSKKSKAVFSFLCFFFSIIILTGSMIVGIYAAVRYNDISQKLRDAFNPDFQNTYMFKQAMGNHLLSIADQLSQKNANESDFYLNIFNEDTGKNILYSAGTDKNPAEFTNYISGIDLNSIALPDGYNFKLYFDGKKAVIIKDGKNIDIYGDGIYRSDKGMWYIPGYTTNTKFDNLTNARITILVRKELIQPVDSINPLSSISAEQRYYRIMVYVCGGILLFEIILFVLYILFRRDKKQADLALARFSGWFWWEFKALCTIALIFGDFFFMSAFWHSDWFYWGICAIISFFCYYLIINDMRYNPQFYKHNIFHSALKNYRRFELTKPFQKQMVTRFWALLASELSIMFLGILIIAVAHFSNTSGFVFSLCVIAVMGYLIYRYVRRFQNTVYDMGLLMSQISLVKSGDCSSPLELPDDADLSKAVRELNDIQSGISKAVDERMKSEHMKIDLITNVSHDLKTPLTSIISYVDLLNQEDELPDHVKDYIEVLVEKSDRLKNMVQDIFEVSKATSGNIELNMERLDLGKLIRQTLADMNEVIESSGLTFKVEIPDSPVMIQADGKLLYRVFQNLIGNALQYSLEGSRIFVTVDLNGAKSTAAVKNTSRFELDSEKDMTERFVRGDSSRTTDGSGLGLSIARSFTEACGGSFRISTNADLFTAEVGFNRVSMENSVY